MKSVEFYVALIAAALFVFESNKTKPFWSRFVITLSSAGLGFSVSPELSLYVGGSLVVTGLLVTALGFLILETSTAIIADTTFVKNMISKKLD